MINKEYIEIQELVEAIIDNRGKTVPTSVNGIPLIATNCIKHSSIFPTFENIRYINQETYDNWFRAHLKPNDILFVNKGTPGRCCIVPNPVNFVAAQDMVGLRFKKHLNPYYMLAVLRSKEIQNTIENNHVGLVIAHFRKQELVKLKLPILEETIRNKIGDFYEIISKKIELNNRINAELEAMAKTLYDYWFVQFDFPVASTDSATTTGTATEISGENMASAPLSQQSDEKNTAAERSQRSVAERSRGYKSSGGKMVYNETLKREIPEGWEVKKLKKVLKTYLGGTPSTKNLEYWRGNIPWLNSGEVANFPLINTEQFISKEAVKNSSTKFLKKGSVLLSITRHLRVNILGIDACVNQSVAGIEENEKFKYPYIYFFLINDINRLMSLRSGAQQPHINKETVDTIPFLVPSENILNKYYIIATPIFEKIFNNAKQNQELSALRDWLLPMLMNGQVKVG